jgi:tryptophanyl-tRNA synthetase
MINTRKILTGVRPTGILTIANYLGAVKPIIDLQTAGERPYLFVADLHATTDNEPGKITEYIKELVIDYLALGLDPAKCVLYRQSAIKGEVTTLMSYLARLISVAELMRVPTLKDKIKGEGRVETANALLLLYPVLMAADILIQRSTHIPVGEDQIAHIEVSRLLANRFNDRYGKVFPIPQAEQVKSLRILSLKGEGKSTPEGALLMSDTPKDVAGKIKRAQTALEGEMTPSLESLIVIAKGLADSDEVIAQIDEVIARHLKGDSVMGQFKSLVTEIVQKFLADFQIRREALLAETGLVDRLLSLGNAEAQATARETMDAVEQKMFGTNL